MTAPTLTASKAVVALARRAARWLDAENGNGPHELTLRLMKVSEEYGEVLAELDPDRLDLDAAVRESVDVIVTALTAAVSLDPDYGPPLLPAPATVPVPLVAALRLGVEVGKVASARIGETGQNPRKGCDKTTTDILAQLDRVVVVAAVLIASLDLDPERAVLESVARIQTRLTEMGVPA